MLSASDSLHAPPRFLLGGCCVCSITDVGAHVYAMLLPGTVGVGLRGHGAQCVEL